MRINCNNGVRPVTVNSLQGVRPAYLKKAYEQDFPDAQVFQNAKNGFITALIAHTHT